MLIGTAQDLTVLSRRHAELLVERAVEVAHIAEPRIHRDGDHAVVRAHEQLQRMPHAAAGDVFRHRATHQLRKHGGKVVSVHVNGIGKLLQRKGFRKAGIDHGNGGRNNSIYDYSKICTK